MQRHRLPHTDLDVSPLCLGTGSFGTGVKGDDADRVVGAFLEAGGNFFDTAHCYAFWVPGGLGASERELGATLRRLGKLDQAVIASKGAHPDSGQAYRRPDHFLGERVIASDIDESLNRLGIESIDLYYLHRDDGRTPVGEVIEILNRQVQRGHIRYLGASNWSVARLAAANAYAAERGLRGFVASQPQWSLAQPAWSVGADPTMRTVTEEEIAWHSELQDPLVVYSATANGYFAGKEIAAFDTPQNQARRERAASLALRNGCSPTQIALAWLMQQAPLTIPIFSTRRLDHLQEALGSVQVTLTGDEVAWLRDGE